MNWSKQFNKFMRKFNVKLNYDFGTKFGCCSFLQDYNSNPYVTHPFYEIVQNIKSLINEPTEEVFGNE